MAKPKTLKGKRILVAGAAGAIGQACTAQLIAQDARVIASDRPVRAPAHCQGPMIRYMSADLRHEAKVRTVCHNGAKLWGGLDGLLNCAAVLEDQDTGALAVPLAAWQATLAVNLTAAFLLTKYCLPFLIDAGGGSIVHISSIVARLGSAESQLAYTTSKGGLEAMTREIAVAYASKNIRANAIAPGPVKTKRNQHFFKSRKKLQARLAHIPLGRLGTAQEVASLGAFLLSDAASYITAATIPVDGGLTAAYLAQQP